ncbi:hypothetical protein K469DRAFT_675971 [Zopfia rhizophila CBS 207.26]|uniref:NAD(P)-binding protein n=1 Tax=Zopfia rhizophila CBS 207.26 TaxID=1314779 RepID=A0A6A6DIL9_9PEZI|nr:hypothetical protein K469DRAFT_675971 [Zopfia rhizophila CBS 207.26]
MMLPEFKTTKTGVESQFGINHIGHFLFMNLLMPTLLKSPSGPCVVNISSAGHRASGIRLDDINFKGESRVCVDRKYESFLAYEQSKTANILFSVALTQKGLRSYGVDPGRWWNADGSLGKIVPWSSVGQGASTYIVAAFDKSLDKQSGNRLASYNIHSTTESYALDPEIAEKLWVLSEKLVGQEFRYD